MNRTLIWLLLRSLRGRLVRGARLLRQPKYLAGLLIGLGYLGWVLTGPMTHTGVVRGDGGMWLEENDVSGLVLVAAGILAVVALIPWILLPGDAPIRLNAAEIHCLLPAPLNRRAVINYALWKGLPASVFAALVLTYVSGLGWLRLPALLVGFITWDLFSKLRNLWKIHPGAGWGRRLVPLGAMLYLAMVVFGLWQISTAVWTESRTLQTWDDHEVFITSVSTATQGSWLNAPLLPFRWAIGPVFAANPGELLRALVPAILLALVLHAVVLTSQVRFEDAALSWERKRFARATRRHGLARFAGRRRGVVPFKLSPLGAPEVAVMWKNLIGGARFGPRDVILGCLVLFSAVAGLVVATGASERVLIIIGVIATQVGVFAVVASASLGRKFVGDLKSIEVVRTWPLRPTRFAVMTSLGCAVPGLALAVAAGTCFVAMEMGIRIAALVNSAAPESLIPTDVSDYFAAPPWMVLLVFVAVGIVAVTGLSALVGSIQTVASLLFPGWAVMLSDPKENPAVMGQRILVAIAMIVVLAVALIPAAVLVGGGAAVHHLTDTTVQLWEAPLAVMAFLLPVLGVALLLCRLAGTLWTRLDPSGEILQH